MAINTTQNSSFTPKTSAQQKVMKNKTAMAAARPAVVKKPIAAPQPMVKRSFR